MSSPHRIIIIASSIVLLLIVAISLAAALEVRAPTVRPITQIPFAKAQKIEELDLDLVKGKAKINGSDFDRASIIPPPTVYLSTGPTLVPTSDVETRTSIDGEEGMIGETPAPNTSPTSVDEGYIAPDKTPAPEASPNLEPQQPPSPPQQPILALSYSGSGGPKHCRGSVIQKMNFPSPISDPGIKNGTCVDLPKMARCGVFFADKEAGCQADLFNMPRCLNNSETYVNTVVFMPEERTVGAYWRSMWVKCGVEAPEAKLIDPNILKGLVHKPGGG